MIVVTGAAGFIGSNLVAALASRGVEDIVVCDYLGTQEKWRNIAKYEVADIITPEEIFIFLNKNSASIDTIFHLGAISSTTETNIDLIVKNNIRFSIDLWNWCSVQQINFIYASSAATYGNGNEGFKDDDSCDALARLLPMNAYGWSKHLFDRRVAKLVANGAKGPPQWAGLKFFNVYGPNEYHKGSQQSVIPQIFRQVRENGEAKLFKSHNRNYEDGGQLRDFIWVGDCIDVMMWLFQNREISGLFNCGTGKARSFKELAEVVFSSLNKPPKIAYIPTPEGIRAKYQYFTEANIDRLRSAGYISQFTPLEIGVKRYVEYLLSNDPYL